MLLIMENDYVEIEHKKWIDDTLIKKGFRIIHSQKGGWGPCKGFFYQVWRR